MWVCDSFSYNYLLLLCFHFIVNSIHGIAVSDDAVYFHEHLTDILTQVGLEGKVRSHDILNVIEGYKGQGYGIAQEEDYGIYTDIYCTLNPKRLNPMGYTCYM